MNKRLRTPKTDYFENIKIYVVILVTRVNNSKVDKNIAKVEFRILQ